MLKAAHRNPPLDYFMVQEPRREGSLVGTFAGREIPERVTDCYGEHFRFAGVAPRLRNGGYDLDALRPGECLVEPGLIYAHEPARRTK